MKICLILGTRPQIIKSWSFVKACREKAETDIKIIHTGQHDSSEMATQFYNELGFAPNEFIFLDKTKEKSYQLAEMISRITWRLQVIEPDVVVVPGDTRSALAGALAASYNDIPLIHIEAGVRCGKMIEEEKNRIVVDNLSDLLCCPTKRAQDNLRMTESKGEFFLSGDTHYDSWLHFKNKITDSGTEPYNLLTLHRRENLQNQKRFMEIMDECLSPIIFPIHPHTKKVLREWNLKLNGGIQTINPVGYADALNLIRNARHVYTDSGGVQREAYWFEKDCTVLRNCNEWEYETSAVLHNNEQFGDGNAGKKIRDMILEMF